MEIRALTIEDSPEVTGLINRFERFWDLPSATSTAQVEDDLTEPFVDLSLDSRGYWLDDVLVAYGLVSQRPSGERQERALLPGLVDPDWRGQGIGRHLLAWQVDRAAERLARCDPALPRYLRTAEYDWIEDTHHLHRRFGLEPVRYIKRMIRPVDEPAPVDVLDGVEIVVWDRALDEGARQAQNEAFADHWGSVPVDAESYAHRLKRDGVRLDVSYLAISGQEVVGECLNAFYPEDEAVTGRREGWVESLGVKRAFRGRGVASALLSTSFNAFRKAGLTHSMIGVDSDNPTGAFRLYENLGYRVLQTVVISELEVSHDPP